MKNRPLRTAALLLALATLLAAAACKSGGGASSAAPESVSPVTSEDDGSPRSVELESIVDDGLPAVSYDGPDGVLDNLRLPYSINSDVVGWLTLTNAGGVAFMDYPVVQSYDNNFYLRRTLYGGYASGGTVFMHYRCDPVNLSENTTIFGHNLKDHTLFAQLLKYRSASFYNSAPIIDYSTLYKKYRFKIFAAFYTTVRFDYIRPSYSASGFSAVVNEALARSSIKTNVDVAPDDSIITLSTCAYVDGVEGARFVVMGRLLREGESAGGCAASENPNALDIRQPYRP